MEKAKPQETKATEERNEGEGNRTAARAYNKATEEFAQSGQVEPKARAAEKAREGAERRELDDAELVGKSHAAGEDPALKRR